MKLMTIVLGFCFLFAPLCFGLDDNKAVQKIVDEGPDQIVEKTRSILADIRKNQKKGNDCEDNAESNSQIIGCIATKRASVEADLEKIRKSLNKPDGLKEPFSRADSAMGILCLADSKWGEKKFSGGTMARGEELSWEVACKEQYLEILTLILSKELKGLPTDLVTADTALNLEYKDLLRAYRKGAFAAVIPTATNAQKKWIKYRDEMVNFTGALWVRDSQAKDYQKAIATKITSDRTSALQSERKASAEL